jgi:hypothetical protein
MRRKGLKKYIYSIYKMADETNQKTFQERVDTRACEWLLTQLSTDTFNDQLTDGDKHDLINFTATKKILNEFKNNRGNLKTKYSKSIKDIP